MVQHSQMNRDDKTTDLLHKYISLKLVKGSLKSWDIIAFFLLFQIYNFFWEGSHFASSRFCQQLAQLGNERKKNQ